MAHYDTDLVLWTQEQAARLRAAADAGSNLELDWLNIAEEIESLGRSDKRALRSHLGNLVEHLLKLSQHDEQEPRRGWINTVDRRRDDIAMILDDSPSLCGRVPLELENAVTNSVDSFRKAGLPAPDPSTMQTIRERALDADYLPDGPEIE